MSECITCPECGFACEEQRKACPWCAYEKAALVPEVERDAGAEPEYCDICSHAKTGNDYEIQVCNCLGIQTYAMSCYPGEHKLVPTHPNNGGETWYRREDVDALLRREQRYESLCAAQDGAQNAHYALEEGEYRSALEYIAEAEKALATARKLIEPEMWPNAAISDREEKTL